jgi:hypothetical protein
MHRIPSLASLEGEASADQRNATIVELVALLGQDPPDDLAAAIAVVATFRWTAEDIEGPELLAELRQSRPGAPRSRHPEGRSRRRTLRGSTDASERGR